MKVLMKCLSLFVIICFIAGCATIQPKQQGQDDEIVYITKTGSKYHRAGCRYLRQSAIPIKKSKAKKVGYTPCSVCKPGW